MDHDDRGVVSLPKLIGGPRYARPPRLGVPQTPRPPDPDELPLVSERTPEDHALAQELGIESLPHGASAGAPGIATPAAAGDGGQAHHGNGTWTVAEGTGADRGRSLHRGFGLFRGRNGRSGIG